MPAVTLLGAPEMRDWANKLPSDLAAEIAGCLLATDDLTEYIRFRAVCKPWRRSTPDPSSSRERSLDARFFPRNWVMLPNHHNHNDDEEDTRTRRRRLMLNVVTGASIAVDDDHLDDDDHRPLGYTDGLLVLRNTATSSGGIRLLNPVTRAVTDLPGFSSATSASASALKDAMDGAFFSYRCFVGVVYSGRGPATVVLLFMSEKDPLLAFIRPGEPRWSLADTTELALLTDCRPHQVSSVLSLRGLFYVSTSTGDVLALDLHHHPVPRLVRVVRYTAMTPATTTTVPAAVCSVFLAPSGNGDGMLMVVVHAGSGENEFRERIQRVEVFEVDVHGRRLVARTSVGADRDRALFIGSVRALCVSTKVFPSIAAGAVYLCHGQGYRGDLFRVVHIGDDGRAERAVESEFFEQVPPAGQFFGPFNLDVYLACCVDALSFC